MRLLRSAAPTEAQSAMLAAQRETIRRTACQTPDTRQEHFIWPTGGRPSFYWFAVEAVVSAHADDFDRLPVIVEADGFARDSAAAHRAAERAFDSPRISPAVLRVAEPVTARHNGPLMRALATLVLILMLIGVLGSTVFVVGEAAQDAAGKGPAIAGFVGGGLLNYWIEDHR